MKAFAPQERKKKKIKKYLKGFGAILMLNYMKLPLINRSTLVQCFPKEGFYPLWTI